MCIVCKRKALHESVNLSSLCFWTTPGKGNHYVWANNYGWRRMTAGSAERSQQCHKCYLQNSTFASERPQVEHGVVKLVYCPGRHLTSLRPCPNSFLGICKLLLWNYIALTVLGLDPARMHTCLLEETPVCTSSFISCFQHFAIKVLCFWCEMDRWCSYVFEAWLGVNKWY